MGTKTSDLETFPLCCTRPGVVGCHEIFDLCVEHTKAERRELTRHYVARMQAIAKADGRPEFKK
jgi:hypothetical protein